jgi:hypothetical protein
MPGAEAIQQVTYTDMTAAIAAAISGITPNTGIFTAGESLAAEQIVYLTSGQVFKAGTSSPSGSVVGVTMSGATVGNPVTVLFGSGKVTGFSGLTPDTNYYVSANGSISTTMPSSGLCQSVGRSISSTTLLFELGVPISR